MGIQIRTGRLLLTAALLAGLLAGCGPSPAGDEDDIAYRTAGIAGDSTLLTINGTDVQAEEYLFFLGRSIETAMDNGYLGDDAAWAADIGGQSAPDYLKQDALNAVKLQVILRNQAAELGVGISQVDQAELESNLAKTTDVLSTQGMGLQDALDTMCVSEETFRRINETYYLGEAIIQAMSQPGGELEATDARVRAFVEERLQQGGEPCRFYYAQAEEAALLEQWFPGRFNIQRSPEDDEYLYSRQEQLELKGRLYRHQRNDLRRAQERHALQVFPVDAENLEQCRKVLNDWKALHHSRDQSGLMDVSAGETMLRNLKELKISGVLVKVCGKPAAVAAGYPLTDTVFDLCVCQQTTPAPEISTAVTSAAPAWAAFRAKVPVWVKQSSTRFPGQSLRIAWRLYFWSRKNPVFWPSATSTRYRTPFSRISTLVSKASPMKPFLGSMPSLSRTLASLRS